MNQSYLCCAAQGSQGNQWWVEITHVFAKKLFQCIGALSYQKRPFNTIVENINNISKRLEF
jgi:hypothetical protein